MEGNNRPVDPSLLETNQLGFFGWLFSRPALIVRVVLGGLFLGCFLFALCGENVSVHSQVETTDVLLPE